MSCSNVIVRSDDFCSVVLAGGYGNKLYPLTETYPKCLLNVGNYPLIYYTLEALENAGFTETIIIIQENWLNKIKDNIEMLKMKIKIEYHSICDFYPNTATVLFNIKDQLKCDNIFIISADIYGEIRLRDMAATYRRRNATLCAYIQSPQSNTNIVDDNIKYNKNKSETNNFILNCSDYIGFSEIDERLLICQNEKDVSSTLSISKNLLIQYPNFKIYKNHYDLHIYIIKKQLLDFISKKSLLNFKTDVISFLLENQFSRKNISDNLSLFSHQNNQDLEFIDPYPLKENIFFKEEEKDDKPIRCYAYIAPNNYKSLRVDNISSFFIANIMSFLSTTKNDINNIYNPNININKDYILGINSTIGNMTELKRVCIGRNCNIGNKCKIINSIILNDVIIEDNSTITNSIIANGAKITVDSQYSECLIGINEIIPYSEFTKSTK